ncbi:MAG: ChbG/HpnK family deacetylase [Oscillospiraceae bacterium]|nr:ChbG/HpnK family deacetylase [Oscillospiraceae bacterium]
MEAIRQYLITADDYGMCPEVDSAIERLAERGVLSTTNVLMNFGTDFSHVPIRSYPRFSVGLHWNVTTGFPVTEVSKIRTLLDGAGRFLSINAFRRAFKKHEINTDELALELQNQYDMFKAEFGYPDYWNTHENSSLYPAEFKVFEAVALKNGIKATRNFQRVYIDYDLCHGTLRKLREFAVKSYVNVKYGVIERKKFTMPEGRIVTFVNISKTDINRMKLGLAKSKKHSIEIVIHPATSGDNPLFGNISTDRVAEFCSYMSDEFLALFENESSRIVSFNEL